MAQYGIPIMFDVDAPDADEAARLVVQALAAAGLVERHTDEPESAIESWWTIAAEDKHADGNDNAPGAIVFEADMAGRTALAIVGNVYDALGIEV